MSLKIITGIIWGEKGVIYICATQKFRRWDIDSINRDKHISQQLPQSSRSRNWW